MDPEVLKHWPFNCSRCSDQSSCTCCIQPWQSKALEQPARGIRTAETDDVFKRRLKTQFFSLVLIGFILFFKGANCLWVLRLLFHLIHYANSMPLLSSVLHPRGALTEWCVILEIPLRWLAGPFVLTHSFFVFNYYFYYLLRFFLASFWRSYLNVFGSVCFLFFTFNCSQASWVAFLSELCYVNKLLLIEWVNLKGQVNRQE